METVTAALSPLIDTMALKAYDNAKFFKACEKLEEWLDLPVGEIPGASVDSKRGDKLTSEFGKNACKFRPSPVRLILAA